MLYRYKVGIRHRSTVYSTPLRRLLQLLSLS